MGETSYTRCAERFTWPMVTQGFVELFESVGRRPERISG
jgi:hypothetical protein